MAKILLYTSITGDYEQPRDDIRVETLELFKDPTRSARMHKCLTPDFDDYDFSIWIDGNTTLEVTPEFLVEQLGNADILAYKHWTPCVYEEARHVVGAKFDTGRVINPQMTRYFNKRFPINNGVTVTTYLIRRHNSDVETFNSLWWAEICKGSKRDQLSFDYVVWRTGIKVKYFEEQYKNIHKDNTYFNYYKHNEIQRISTST